MEERLRSKSLPWRQGTQSVQPQVTPCRALSLVSACWQYITFACRSESRVMHRTAARLPLARGKQISEANVSRRVGRPILGRKGRKRISTMPAERLANTEEAAQWLMRLDQKFQTNKALRHLSAIIELETFFRDLLYFFFGWSLTNANWSAQMNQDSFDLLDVKRGIAIQVTSTTDTAKIRKTLETFHDHGHRNIKRLVFAYPCLRKPEPRANLGSLAPAVNFDPVSDRLDFSDLLRAIQVLPIDAQDEVVRLLRRELHPLGAALGLHREECGECGDESAEAVRPLFRHPERPCVGIIGLGISGSETAIRLMELATEPLNLLLINSRDYARFGGLACGEAGGGGGRRGGGRAGRGGRGR